MSYLIVFLGAGIGGMLRHAVNQGMIKYASTTTFPFGTMAINILGSMLMGIIVGYFALKGNASQHWRLFLTTGILGGFTTFSAFSLDAALLYQRGHLVAAAGYVLGSVGIAILALFAGMAMMRSLT